MPKVSVVIPTFNYGRYVGEAIASVLAQTHMDIELVVVDDGSTDNTAEVVGRFPDPRLRYVRQENRGLAGARNTGIRESSAEYIGFLDSDDSWLPRRLERQLPLLEDDAVGHVCCGYFVKDESAGTIVTRAPSPLRGDVLRTLAVENRIAGSATTSLIRRSLFDRIGLFDETLRACEDWDVWLRLARVTRFDYVDEPLATIRLHSSNMMRETDRMESSMTRVIRRFYADTTLSPSIRGLESRAWATAYLTLAKLALRARRRRLAAQYLLRAIRNQPFWLDPYIVLSRTIRL